MTLVSSITRGTGPGSRWTGAAAGQAPRGPNPPLRPGTPRETGRRRAAGGAGALGASVTTRGEKLIDW